jgi:hypothetical protein
LSRSFDVADLNGETAYPFVLPLFVGWNDSDNSNCTERRELVKFLRWGVTSNIANDRTIESGYVV